MGQIGDIYIKHRGLSTGKYRVVAVTPVVLEIKRMGRRRTQRVIKVPLHRFTEETGLYTKV